MTATFEEIVQEYGPWTSFNVEFEKGKYTMGRSAGIEWPIRRANFFGQQAETLLNKEISSMHILDLGCLEGSLSYHLGVMGASVIGLEAREMNLAKCRFVAEKAELESVHFIQGDMLNLPDDLTNFDLIIASGVLYHVDAPDILPFLGSLAQRATMVIFDTHFSAKALEYYDTSTGLRVFGRSIVEHSIVDDDIRKDTKAWASYRNNFSFWPTKRGLLNLMREAGFNFVYEPLMPQNEWAWQDRGIFVADTRPPRFKCGYPLNDYIDPDPRPTEHHQFHHQHHMKPKNPSTIPLYNV